MSPLPVGTLTLLFSDIEGSTSLLTGLGARWGEALSAHREIMRAAFRAHGGREVGTEGDSFFVVFTSAAQAVQAAVAAQRGLHEHAWPDGRAVRVRIGLHTGEPQRHDDDYIGLDVHRAARIMATAHGGQIVMSEPTHALVAGSLSELRVRDLGWHRLKDIPEPEHLYDVTAPELPTARAPLRSLGAATALPTHATALVGRDAELHDVTAALEAGSGRLVTLTGPGGTGKTRLAVAVAREVRRRTPLEVFFVPLETADRASLMWAVIAEAVGAPVRSSEQPPDERALETLRDRPALLVLDNLEQIPDADRVVSHLLNEAPDVRVLATSRRPLHLVDERQYQLRALSLPDPGATSVAEAEQAAAVALFVARARLVRPDFRLTPENVGDVISLCRRLDGLPLAIELAAARSRLLGPRALLARIDSRLGEATPSADRPERQRTLAATVSWSHDLLSAEDRRVFRRLGVFSSRVGLDAVESVVASDADDPFDAIARLADASLLDIVEGPDGEPRISLLETIRRFARERLDEHDEADEVRMRHARWCVEVALDITSLLHGPRQMSALDRMDAVVEDVRAALDWTLAPAATAGPERLWCGLALLQPMDAYWYRFGYAQEGRGWFERAVTLVDRGDHGDSPDIVDAFHGHGVLALQQNDLATGIAALERALAMARRLGDLRLEARESNSLGIGRREQGDVEAARQLIEHSLVLARQIKDPQREVTAMSNLVQVHMDRGEYATAVQAARRTLELDIALEDPWGIAVDHCNLVMALLFAEGPRPALRQLVDMAPDAVALGDVELSVNVVDDFAAVWAALGDVEQAATALGAADRQREAAGYPRTRPDQRLVDHFVDPLRRARRLEWEQAYAAGRALGVEEAVAVGLQGARDRLAGAATGKI